MLLIVVFEEVFGGFKVISVIKSSKLKVRFDPEANILYYISIRDDKVKDMEDIVDDDIWVEYNEKGEIIGIEIHRAKELIVPEILKFIDAVKSLKV